MLQVNKKAIKIAEYMSNMNHEDWVKALGLTKGSYRTKMARSGNFTLRQILTIQNLSGLPIQNFFE